MAWYDGPVSVINNVGVSIGLLPKRTVQNDRVASRDYHNSATAYPGVYVPPVQRVTRGLDKHNTHINDRQTRIEENDGGVLVTDRAAANLGATRVLQAHAGKIAKQTKTGKATALIPQ